MAYSYVEKVADGFAATFYYHFPVLSYDDLNVTVDGAEKVRGIHWDIYNPGQIFFLTGNTPPNGAVVRLQRYTSRPDLTVDFKEGSTILAEDLDRAYKQALYVAQEAHDVAAEITVSGAGGDLTALNNLNDVASIPTARANLGAVAKAGDSLTGFLSVHAIPEDYWHVANKGYVDWVAMGSGTAGVWSFNGRTAVVTLTSYDVTNALGYTPVNQAGDTMTGHLLQPLTPTLPNHLANKAYVDSVVGGPGAGLPSTTGQQRKLLWVNDSEIAEWNSTFLGDHVFAGSFAMGDLQGADYKCEVNKDSGALWILVKDRALHYANYEHAAAYFHSYLTTATTASLVGAHAHTYSENNHTGNNFGFVTEVWNTPNKQGKNSPTQLFGAELSILNTAYDSTAWRHAGLLLVFKNRLDTQHTPVNGVPSTGKSYNKNTTALLIDGVDRHINNMGPGGNPYIEGSWHVGIRFTKASLDTAAGVKATGIDFTEMYASAPEGGLYVNRVQSFVAMPSTGKITFSNNKIDSQQWFDPSTGNIIFGYNNSTRVGMNMTDGTIYCWDGVNGSPNQWYVDPAGRRDAIMWVRSGGRTDQPSSTTIANWLAIRVDGYRYKLALYL